MHTLALLLPCDSSPYINGHTQYSIVVVAAAAAELSLHKATPIYMKHIPLSVNF